MPRNKLFRTLLFFIKIGIPVYGQQIDLAEGRAEIIVSTDRSIDEYVKKCTGEARMNAVATSAGLTIFSGQAGLTTEVNGLMKNDTYSQYSEVMSAGYWLGDVKPPEVIKEISPDGTGIIGCSVSGYVKKKNPSKAMTINALECPDINCVKDVYYSGQRLYLNIQSASEGFISVWLEDMGEKKVYRLAQGRKIFPGHATLFFDNEEIILTADENQMQGLLRVFVIRTKNSENVVSVGDEYYSWEGGVKNITPGSVASDRFYSEAMQRQLTTEDMDMQTILINVIK